MTEGEQLPQKEDLQKSEQETKGVKILLGEPKKAIIKLAIPMIIAMSAMTIYNLVDAIWVSGLGTNALDAVGLYYPFFFIVMALAVGLGVGGGAAISRRIGAKDREGADNVALHTLIIMVIMAVFFTIPFFIFAETIFSTFASGEVKDMATAYGRIIFAGSIVIFFMYIATSILRAEGDANRSMYAMMLGAGLNIVLDPIFIYSLDMGVVGAAWATVISMIVTSILLSYWMFIKKDTYVAFKFRSFNWKRDITMDIFRVGLPAMVMQLSMAIMAVILNYIIVNVRAEGGVAVYTVGWRVSMMAILPLLGIATAVVSVCGAAFGARDYDKLKSSFYYAIKLGLIIESTMAVFTVVFAEQITLVFTQAEGTDFIQQELPNYFRIVAIFYPGVAFGMFSSSMFQGIGKGTNALIVTIVRTLVLGTPLAAVFAISFDMGLTGVWWGMVVGNLLGSMLSFSWALFYIRKLTAQTAV
ncbi:MAG: MATE family efflux transporter [Methanomassiliicoccales archaeon]|nr:MAG: MATE family efflux transporter [Methanomassiliicoccales archaeon]